MPKKKVPEDETKRFFIRDVPVFLQRAFKAACGLRGVTMREQLMKLIREWLVSIGSSAEKK